MILLGLWWCFTGVLLIKLSVVDAALSHSTFHAEPAQGAWLHERQRRMALTSFSSSISSSSSSCHNSHWQSAQWKARLCTSTITSRQRCHSMFTSLYASFGMGTLVQAIPGADRIVGTVIDMGQQSLGVTISEETADAGVMMVLLAFLMAAISNVVIPSPVPKKLIDNLTLKSVVQGTYLESRSLQCVYKATRDGWSAISFHQAVDGCGSAVVVTRTISGKTAGGFNPNGWRSTDDYYISNTAFLWALTGGNKITKFPVLPGGGAAAIYDYANAGPCFGSGDFWMGLPQAAVLGGFAGPDMEDTSLSAGNLRRGKSTAGISYQIEASWPIRGDFQLAEIEVYCSGTTR